VIPAAGLGTRLLSVTKEQPKEMLPVFAKAKNGDLCLKPIVSSSLGSCTMQEATEGSLIIANRSRSEDPGPRFYKKQYILHYALYILT
jgi:UTP-glucose-1-phosphate uridylyltransferase